MRPFSPACLMLFAAACGGVKKPAPQQLAPLSEEQARAFDDGVDFVATLEGLEGRWRDDWDHDLSVRVGAAELIAVVTVRTMRTDTDPQQDVTYRLLGHVERALLGNKPADDVELATMPNDPGYRSVQAGLTRIADQKFIAYV